MMIEAEWEGEKKAQESSAPVRFRWTDCARLTTTASSHKPSLLLQVTLTCKKRKREREMNEWMNLRNLKEYENITDNLFSK